VKFAELIQFSSEGFAFHLAAAAFLATSVLFSGVSFFRRAAAPRFPRATAAGFFFFGIHLNAKRRANKTQGALDMLSAWHLC
jgi:hypothetical protein